MKEALKKLVSEKPKDMASRETLSLKIVRKIVGAAVIPIGFQYHKDIVDFEREVGFPTSDAIATLIREERKVMLKRERSTQKEMLEKLFSMIAAISKEEELLRNCYDVSLVVSSMIEALGVRAVVYIGTLFVEDSDNGKRRSFYFLNDVLTRLATAMHEAILGFSPRVFR